MTFSTPAVLQGSAILASHARASDEANKLRNTMSQWFAQFPASKVIKAQGVVYASLPPNNGVVEAMAAMKALLGNQVQSALPRFSSRVTAPRLYGFNDIFCDVDFQPDMLASVRWQWAGTFRVLHNAEQRHH